MSEDQLTWTRYAKNILIRFLISNHYLQYSSFLSFQTFDNFQSYSIENPTSSCRGQRALKISCTPSSEIIPFNLQNWRAQICFLPQTVV